MFFTGGWGHNRNNPFYTYTVNPAKAPVDALFAKSIVGGEFALAIDTVASDIETLEYTFTATTGHPIVAGNEIIMLDVGQDRSFIATVLSVAGDVITLDRPIDGVYAAATTLGRVITTEMAVDGSVTPQIFSVRAGFAPRDITRFIVTMLSATAMDDGRFGGLASLTRGLVLRIVNGYQCTIFNFKSNLDIKQFCYDVSYASKAPAGQYGLVARITFAGQEKHGTALRIAGTDALQWVVQDDLTGLDSLKVAAEGHVTI